MTSSARILARRLSTKPDKTAAVPTQTLPGSLGTSTGVFDGVDGTLGVVYNGATIPCHVVGDFDTTQGKSVLVLCLGTQNWCFGPVNPASTGAAWTPYTPAWDATSSAPDIGNGDLIGHFRKTGNSVALRIFLQGGTTTTVGSGFYSFGLPFPVADTTEQVLACDFYDGANHYGAIALTPPGESVNVYSLKDGSSGEMVPLSSSSFSAGLAAIIAVQGVYESSF